jgi:isoleucyl-tRNA synthetase
VADGDDAAQMRTALTEHADALAAEVLATTVHADEAGAGPGIEGPAGSRLWLVRAG